MTYVILECFAEIVIKRNVESSGLYSVPRCYFILTTVFCVLE
jgi:hypothetical protein